MSSCIRIRKINEYIKGVEWIKIEKIKKWHIEGKKII